ncbi:uncharacterized protein LOC144139863 [Haemaphysalis longicornis]
MAQTGRCFPALDRGLWTKDLPALPTVSEDSYHSGCRAKDPSERQRSRACRLATEAHCSPSSVRTNTCDSQLGLIHVLSSCFRSQNKSGRPYVVCLTFETDSGAIGEASCECPAGCSGAWSHILAAVHLLALLQAEGFKRRHRSLRALSCHNSGDVRDSRASSQRVSKTLTGEARDKMAPPFPCQCVCSMHVEYRSNASSNKVPCRLWGENLVALGMSFLPQLTHYSSPPFPPLPPQ